MTSDTDSRLGRRAFLARGAAGAAALTWPAAWRELHAAVAARPAGADDFWRALRGEFLIPPDRVYLNVGTLGAQPRVVVDAVVEHTRRVAESLPPGTDWSRLKGAAGALLGCDPDGLVFPRNTTEAMTFVANGLELGRGDEVLTTDHEHIGGLCCWELVAARRGVRLRQLPLATPAPADDEIVRMFADAITPATRVISFSHVNFTTGLVMPVAALVRLCRERGIISVVDGAHPPGMIAVDIGALDPDFYASSPHKWLLAPQGTGLLYIRQDWRDKLWPTLASGDWNNLELGAHRFNHLGTFDESRLAGLESAIAFHDSIGAARVHARIRELRALLVEGLREIPRVNIVSEGDARAAGMISFEVAGMSSLELQRVLGAQKIRTRVIGEYDYNWMRLSPHVYTLEEDVERVVAAIRRAAG